MLNSLTPSRTSDLSLWQQTSATPVGSSPVESYQGTTAPPLVAPPTLGTTLAAPPRALRIGMPGTTDLKPRADGGYCIEGPTRTIVYSGEAALNYLKARTHFAMDTEVAIPQGTRVRVKTGDQSFEMNEPGAILLGTGAEAQVEVLEGSPMVVRSQNAPVWYERMAPDGAHSDTYREIAHINGKLYNWHTYRNRFQPADLEGLRAAGVVRDDPRDDRYIQWQVAPSVGAFRRHLEAQQLPSDTIERTMPLYQACYERRLHPADDGYDRSGLAFDSGKVVAYRLGGKFNLWNEQGTEWLVNSTAYAGTNEPFHVGVSYVRTPEHRAEPTDFQNLRPAEVLHRHPELDQTAQTEAYLVRSGRAALLTVTDRGAEVHVMQAGDLAVIDPNVVHCMLAYQGPYEHLCTQVPSTFQYGFRFKEPQQYQGLGLHQSTTQQQAETILGTHAQGTFLLHPDGYNLAP